MTRFGKMMFDATTKMAKPIVRRRWLFWLLAFTWGLPMTMLGLLISLAMLIIGKKPKRFCSIWFFNVGRSWGGFETGCMFLRDNASSDAISKHEYGHAFQNCIYGPLFIFIVAIPSAVRYWQRRIAARIHEDDASYNQKPYDAIWFEGSATHIGGIAAEEFKGEGE